MKKLWLIFAQTTTAGLAVWFLLTTLYPQWRPGVAAKAPPPPVLPAPAPAAIAVTSGPSSYHDAVARAMPAVVNIYTAKAVKSRKHPLLNDPILKRYFGDRFGGDEAQRASSLGSGVIVSEHGYIVTNNHVVESADEIEVALADGRTAEAKVIGTDPDTDLAVIKIDLDKLPVIAFADVEKVQVGDVMLAIGNPFGVGQTVTMGIVSALGRSQLGINTFENFVQTDAAINPGNSGGALVDAAGNLVGINSAIYSNSGGSLGIGFAIPATTVKQVMDAIIKDGAVTRGWLGVEAQDVTPELAASFKLKDIQGALIAGIVRGSPADRAGLRPGDILQSIDGKPVTDSSTMLNLIAALKPDVDVEMLAYRSGQQQSFKVHIGKRPKINNQ
ncbi:Periplasmic pH-dependent serine endoprotease DegQ [Andreprevotia sp. IGB-42]|uniref:Do family serine endopeptidase n=1 Tax=Andreprevotia sp. IGB-42 TaxID=2497473 RepID=UPI0013597D2B|nr:Do family serine endopeptidase [Andreprevotia sp. IGB-42]KAF0814618.1 Periplasmic pH-dependent serine endoprotease DegQ [Andreprevotia sp. IGB-42]